MSAPRLCGLLVFLCYFSVIECELVTLMRLARNLEAEGYLASDLKNYVQSERMKLDRIEAIADGYAAHSAEAQQDMNHYLANPVNAYLLIKRLTIDWTKVLQMIELNNNTQALKDTIDKKSDLFPDDTDFRGTGSALLRLQDTYSLETQHIVRGHIRGVTGSTILTANDCFELGKIAYFKDDFYHSVMWMDQALRSWTEEDVKTIIEAELLDYLSFAIYKQGNLHHAVNYTKRWLGLEPGHARAMANLKFYKEEIARLAATSNGSAPEEVQNVRPRDGFQNTDIFKNYEKLCQGIETHKSKDAHRLHCRYKRDHPLFILAPLKMEVMHFKPWVAVFYDVMTDSEIEKVKELAKPKLHQSMLFGKLTEDGVRTSKSAWLRDEDHSVIRHISERAGALSDLSTSTVEQLQVLHYGIGGHYEPHHDYAMVPDEEFGSFFGNRIATVLFYMTDVEAGGGTVFPRFGAKVFPKKGSCVMWYNLLRNGEGDTLTQHAGCPVLSGTKWVCNKWFHVRGQEFKRPCTLDPSE